MGNVQKTTGFALNYQAEWTYSDSGDGSGATLEARYEDDGDGWENRLPARGTAPPSAVGDEFANFRLKSRRAVREQGDKVVVTLGYESRWAIDEDPATDTVPPRYSMAITLGEEPILTHQRYAELDEVEVAALVQIIAGERFKSTEGKERWRDDITSELGQEVLAKIEDGVSAYLEPTLIWRERRRIDWDDLSDELDLSIVGNIDDNVPGGAPIGGDRNYLFLGAQVDQDESAEFADLVSEWQLSGRNGWDEDLYDPDNA